MSAVLREIELQQEHYSEELVAELVPMLRKNWQSSSSYQESIDLQPNLARYKQMDAAGMVLCMTARDQGKLVGYCIWYIVTSLNYNGKSAHGVAWYVDDEHHGYGISLLRRGHALLRAQKIDRFYWFAVPDSTLCRLLVADGYKPHEVVLEKIYDLPGN
jgi:hypothetical protein